MVPCKRGMSLLEMEVVASLPIPGIPKTLSVMTAPDSMEDSWIAIIVITGSREFFRALINVVTAPFFPAMALDTAWP